MHVRMVEAKTVHKGELSEGQEPGDGEGGKCSSFIASLINFYSVYSQHLIQLSLATPY